MAGTNVMVKLSIYGTNLNPHDITNKIGLQPTEYWNKGETIPGKSIVRKNTCWRVSTGYQESLDINEQIGYIMSLFQDKSSQINELISLLDLEIIISVVINIEDNQKPAMFLDRRTLEFINQIHAEVDIDLYVYS